jgi:hypothetical protein
MLMFMTRAPSRQDPDRARDEHQLPTTPRDRIRTNHNGRSGSDNGERRTIAAIADPYKSEMD